MSRSGKYNEPEFHSVLLVEDDERFSGRLARAFADRGWNVHVAGNPTAAISLANEELIELAVIDLRLGSESGIEAVQALHAADAETVILMLTGYGSIATAVGAIRAGASDYLAKPADVDQLIAAYERLKAGISRDMPPPTAPSLDQVEWDHIHRVLQDCKGNVSHAARILGVHRRSLQRKLAKRPLPNG
jgi:two-component system, response regulator RegA